MYRSAARPPTDRRIETFDVMPADANRRWGYYAAAVVMPLAMGHTLTRKGRGPVEIFYVCAVIAVVLLVVALVYCRPRKVIVDHGLRTVFVRNGRAADLDDIGAVSLVPIPERTRSGDYAPPTTGVVVLDPRRGSGRIELVVGTLETANPVVAAIKKAIGAIPT